MADNESERSLEQDETQGDSEEDIELGQVVEQTGENELETAQVVQQDEEQGQQQTNEGGEGNPQENVNEGEGDGEAIVPAPVQRQESGLVVADEFEPNYFYNESTRMYAWLVMFISIAACIVVTASQLYEFTVLDPPCPENPSDLNLTSCEQGQGGQDISTAAFSVLLGFSIPARGFYGSLKREVVALHAFRIMSAVFGGFALFTFVSAVMNLNELADNFNACDAGEECLTVYLALEGIYIFCYVVLNVGASTLLINAIEEVVEKEEELRVNAEIAQRILEGNVQYQYNTEQDDENLIHELARTVPIRTSQSNNPRYSAV